jgi:hypothetical protein
MHARGTDQLQGSQGSIQIVAHSSNEALEEGHRRKRKQLWPTEAQERWRGEDALPTEVGQPYGCGASGG